MYTDPTGEFWFVAAAIGFVSNYVSHGIMTKDWWSLDALKAGGIGAVSALAGYGIGIGASSILSNVFSKTATSIIAAGIGGSASGTTNALLTGGNVGHSALMGLGSGLLGSALSNLNITNIWAQGGIHIGAGGLTGGIYSAATGGNFWQGFKTGAIGSAVGWGVSKGVNYLYKSVSARAEIEKTLNIQKTSTSIWNKTEQIPFLSDPLSPNEFATPENINRIRELSNQLIGNDLNAKISVNFDLTNAETHKFGNLHIRISPGNVMSYHYDNLLTVRTPVLHTIFESLYQGIRYWNW